uniref:non-specific serine/threonine protein kinase n=1 Tax=Cyanistes caeruleus TaxID=156563 RepID=A0A8C0VM21_CYACU
METFRLLYSQQNPQGPLGISQNKGCTEPETSHKFIRTLGDKLVKYFSRQLSCKRKVALQERNAKLEGFPQLLHWFRIVDIRKEVMEEIAPGQLSLEDLLDMTDEQVCATVEKFGANREECARLNASLSCLRSVHKSGGSLSKQDWTIQWPSTEPGKENSPGCPAEPGPWGRTHPSPKVQPKCGQHHCHASSSHGPMYTHVDRLTVEGHPGLCPPLESGHRSLPPSPRQRHAARIPARDGQVTSAEMPPGAPPAPGLSVGLVGSRTMPSGSAWGSPSPKSSFSAGKHQENHIFCAHPLLPFPKNLYPSSRCCYQRWFPGSLPADTLSVPRWSPQIPRRDLGNSIKHRFSTKYWMSQTCTVCGKGMLFGLKCKNCKLKCHNKCTKEAPPCHLLIIHRGARLVRTESVPCDINNPLRKPPRYSDLHVSQTLPKTNKLNKDHIPVPYQPDSSSNPSSTTSSTPSSPVSDSSLSFPDVVPETPTRAPQVVLHPVTSNPILEGNPLLQIEVEPTSENEEGAEEVQESEDDFEEMNLSLLSARNFPRKASQTSIFLQEWDIPFEQLEIGELIGKGRFGQVFHGRWHGEVAIRLIDIERDNEDQLKAFKREVMAYRQTRHENVVLFMGACMSPPHLAIITSLCKGRTLYSVVRDAKIVLDVNKTRQIAQEIVKGMGYLHAKGILHKDLKSKNVFYDNGKVVITDFGLFSISGVLQAGRRENKLRIQNGWLCHLAPEIIRQLSPDTEEDKLPFSKHSDVFALGTIWYELHAREWPFKTQPAEAIIWQVGRGMKPNLSQIGMGKEISDILLFCWAYEQEERPTFTKLMDMLEKLPKRNRRLSHPGHFWKSAE